MMKPCEPLLRAGQPHILPALLLLALLWSGMPTVAASTAYWDKYYDIQTGKPKPGTRPMPMVHVLYTRTRPYTGEMLTGRTSGYGHPTWQLQQLDKRTPDMREQGFDPPKLVHASINRNIIKSQARALAHKQFVTGKSVRYGDMAFPDRTTGSK